MRRVLYTLAAWVLLGWAVNDAAAWCTGYAPWDPRHNGGGSSAPSAAAVARQRYETKARAVWVVTDPAELARLAIADADVEVRRLAVGQLVDVKLLKKVYAEATDVEVRVIVVWKLRGVVPLEDDDPAALRAAVKASQAVREQTFYLGKGVTMEFVWCPPGEFIMGSPTSESGRDRDEVQHRVILTRGFWLGKHEVTQAQWQRVMGTNPSHFKEAPRAPVENVSWDDCQGFSAKLNARAVGTAAAWGREFRLPTEAEWEYACRAGSTAALHSGTELTTTTGRCQNLDPIAWHVENSGSTTSGVGQKRPNAWGLYDMLGNVWEWCQDGYGDYPARAVTDPTGPGAGADRVNRGGSWCDATGSCRSAERERHDPGRHPSSGLGFRLARTAAGP